MISVIMGVKDAREEELRAAIESITAQSYKEWEYIICDDGSVNNTYKVLTEYAEADSRIKIIRNEKNQGLAYSLNRCIKEAQGEYIARMDADDISAQDRLESQLEFLQQHEEYAVVGCFSELIDESGVWGRRQMPVAPEKNDFLWGSPFMHPTVMMRREVLEAVGGYRVARETLRLEDYDMFMRMYIEGYKGANLNRYLYQFREDKAAFGRKKYSYRIDEVKIRAMYFGRLGLLPKGYLYMIKPLIVGLIPQKVLRRLRKESC